MDREVDSYLRRKYESSIRDIEVVHKEDLDLVGLHKISSSACRKFSSKQQNSQCNVAALLT